MSTSNLNSIDTSEPEEQVMLPCDRRYRDSDYFQKDQLRLSEAAKDIRDVRGNMRSIRHNIQSLLHTSSTVSIQSTLQFQPVAIHTNS